jgi:hypothetical protein
MKTVKFRQALTLGLMVQMIAATNLATAAQAEMISTGSAIAALAAETDRQTLLTEISRDDVRAELVALGIDPAEAEARLNAMTDDEVAATLRQIDDGTAGADLIGTLGTIFLILLLTDLLCLTNLFSFTRCAR